MATKAITKYRTRFVTRPRRKASKMTIPIAPLAGLSVGMYTPLYQMFKEGNPAAAMRSLQMSYCGWDPEARKFNMTYLSRGLMPLVGGLLVHKFVGGKLGLNRSLAAAGVPFIRL